MSKPFRKGFGWQYTLLRLLEEWHEGAAAMDLSKAFDSPT